MRLTKGNKVEVFSTKEVPSGSWYPVEIIHGNGRNYTVKYEGDIGSQDEEIFDRVPRKASRPCPPVMKVLQDWASGDVVEVYHCLCWKMATVLRVMGLGRDRLSVRLLGSSHELEVSSFDIRPRICWQDDEWKVIGQGSSNHEERQDVPSKLKWNRSSRYMGTVVSSGQEIHTNSSQCLKRKLKNCHSQRAYTLQCQKIRVIEKGSKKNQFTSLRQPPLPEKVDAVASSPALLIEKCMPPFNNRLTGCSKTILGRQKFDGMGYSHALSLESRGADSITSSVASCSISRINISSVPEKFYTGSFEDNECNSDAESFCRMGSEVGNYLLLPADEKLTKEVHRTEMQAYRSIIEALYVSGPLSWEQETLLTNLRGSLHITNDEHLMELRNLVSTSTCIPAR